MAPPARAEDQIVKLVSSADAKCLQPVNGSTAQGAAIVQKTCNGSTAQQWTVHLVSSTKVHLINRASGLCLDARGKAVNGTPIQQWACNSITSLDPPPGLRTATDANSELVMEGPLQTGPHEETARAPRVDRRTVNRKADYATESRFNRLWRRSATPAS